jgi:hypothetical protein
MASLHMALSIIALDLLLDVEKCLLIASKIRLGSFPALIKY